MTEGLISSDLKLIVNNAALKALQGNIPIDGEGGKGETGRGRNHGKQRRIIRPGFLRLDLGASRALAGRQVARARLRAPH